MAHETKDISDINEPDNPHHWYYLHRWCSQPCLRNRYFRSLRYLQWLDAREKRKNPSRQTAT